MDNIKVTVYCWAYNHEKYIRKALEGFVNQKTCFDYEVLIHDDASTDKTAEIIREYELKYPDIVKPIYQKENQYSKGINIANEYLLPRTLGKYVAFCEGDDYWVDENKLQRQYDIMESNPKVYLCTHSVQCVSEDCNIKQKIIPEEKYNLRQSAVLLSDKMAELLYEKDGYPFQTSSYFMRKEVVTSEIVNILKEYINGDAIRLRTAMYLGNVYYDKSVMSYRRLWTTGNWNNRMKNLTKEMRATYLVEDIEGDILFDKVTNFRFHKWILPYVYQKMYLIVRDCEIIPNSSSINKYRIKSFFEFLGSKKLVKKMGKYYLYRIRVTLKSIYRKDKYR